MKAFAAGLAVLSIATLALAPKAEAVPIDFFAVLNGPSEVPVNASPGTGTAHVTIDFVTNTMHVVVSFSGLIGTTTASHIHCCTTAPFNTLLTAGVATTTPTFPGFPLGVTSGFYDVTFDMTLASSYNPTYITNNGGTPASAEAALFNGMLAGKSYLNVHSSFAPGGEIRGFLVVPEPATLALFGADLIAFGAMRRRRTAKA